MIWREAKNDPQVFDSVRERLKELAQQELTFSNIAGTIKEEFDVKIHIESIRRNLTELGIEKIDCRTFPKLETDLDREWAKIRVRESKRRYEERMKEEAFEKLAEGNPPECGHCGCPHLKALTIGHINGSRIHKRRNKALYRWIVKTPIETVRQHLRFECMYCNFYEGFHGEYPPLEETPIWRNKT